MSMISLASALELPCGATIPNRIAKAATSEALADRRSGEPTDRLARVYERWGQGGAGLLITGNVIVDSLGRTEPGNVVLDDGHAPKGLAAWARAAQAEGARLWMQINHAGRQTPRRINRRPVAPSPVTLRGFGGLFARPRPLDDDEIEALIARFAGAARLAQRAGFSGVEIHAAHGYLVSQFLSPLTNQRTDRWGGSAEARMQFLLAIVRAVRSSVGPTFPIGVKLNSADFQRGGFTEAESMAVVQALEHERIDLLEISGGSYEQSAMMGEDGQVRASTAQREAYFLDYARQVRARTKLPLLLTGGLRTAATMRQVVADGSVDMIGMARPMIVEPDLPRRLIEARAEGAVKVDTRTGVKMFDDMLQIVWYQAQLRRMAAGLAPDPDIGRWGPLASGFLRSYAFNPLALFLPARASGAKRLAAPSA